MAKGDDIWKRLIRFSGGIVDLCEHLPTTTASKHIAVQLVRSGTAGAPNYAEARAAESCVDFIHKLGVTLKELNETQTWLLLLQAQRMVPDEAILPLVKECDELCRIMAVSRRTARAKTKK